MGNKPTILLDFDGPVHAYRKGWSDGTIYDSPTVGAFDAIRALALRYKIVIFSTRASSAAAIAAILLWFELYGLESELINSLEITNVKKPALFTIDDRAIRFLDWGQAMLEVLDRYGSEIDRTEAGYYDL